MQKVGFQNFNKSSDIGGGVIGTFSTGRRLIMRCLETGQVSVLNSGSTTADWARGGTLTLKIKGATVSILALPTTRCG